MKQINVASPNLGPEEEKAVKEVLVSGQLAQGPKVAQFEDDFAKYCGVKYALALNNGTAALHAALFAAGVREGDEVITVPFSFIATVNAILMQGAKPVLVDIDPETFNINTELIEKAITKKTKAIIPVDLYGQPYEYAEVKKIAAKHKLIIIEDACQSIGAEYKGIKAGALGDIACFSLYATKNIMSGEGGVITTNNKAFVDIIRRFRQHGMDAQYEYKHIGYNYRMSDLHAAVAIEQLKKTDEFNRLRQANARALTAGLKGIKGLILPVTLLGRTHVYHQYTVRITKDFSVSRDDFVQKMREKGIGVGVYYPKPLHSFAHITEIGYKIGDFPVAEQAAAQVVSLPVHPKVTAVEVSQIVKAIKELADAR